MFWRRHASHGEIVELSAGGDEPRDHWRGQHQRTRKQIVADRWDGGGIFDERLDDGITRIIHRGEEITGAWGSLTRRQPFLKSGDVVLPDEFEQLLWGSHILVPCACVAPSCHLIR